MIPPAITLPRLRSDLKFSPITEGKETWYVIEDPMRHLFYRIGLEEYQFIRRINSARSLDSLLKELAADGIAFSTEQVQTILEWLGGRQLLRQDDTELLAKQLSREREVSRSRRVNRLNLITFKLPLFNPDPLLDRVSAYLVWLTGPLFFTVWLLAGLLALAALYGNWSAFAGQAAGFFSPANLIWIWLIWFGLKILHELFHALTCRRYGGRVYEAGLLFILFIPLTYVNATSSWNFPTKWQRIHVAVAGMFSELAVAFAALLVWERAGTSPAGLIAHNTVMIAGVSSLIFNANPLMRFDGYYVLSDLLSIPNLYSQGLQTVRNLVARLFWGVAAVPALPAGSSGRCWFIWAYGLAVYAWRVLVLTSLAWLASRMGGGFGIFIALGALLVWIGVPLGRLVQTLPALNRRHPGLARRFGLRLLLAGALLCAAVWGLGWEERVQAPAVVEYGRQFRVRNSAGGFVDRVFVKNSQQVHEGDILLQLQNSHLAARKQDLELQLQQIEIQARVAHSEGKPTDLQLLAQQRRLLEEELGIVASDLAGLAVRSPGDGQVVADNLDSLPGRFLPRGSELMWVVTPEQMRLAVSVGQQDIDVFRFLQGAADGRVDIDMRAAGMGRFHGKIAKLEPQATTELIHPALAAIYGGPLDVRQTAISTDGEMLQRYQIELFEPRVKGYVTVPDPILQRIRAGQTAVITTRGSRVTLARVMGGRLRSWLENKGDPVR